MVVFSKATLRLYLKKSHLIVSHRYRSKLVQNFELIWLLLLRFFNIESLTGLKKTLDTLIIEVGRFYI